MKANKLMLAAILTSASGAPIAAFAADKGAPAASKLPVEGEMPSLAGATE
jgi:hypothetical protein